MSCELYRHYDKDDVLLYVGISLSAVARLSQHKDSRWFSKIARVEIEQCETREYASWLEYQAFEREKPLYNLVRPACDPDSPTLKYFLVQGARAEIYEKAWNPAIDVSEDIEICNEVEAEILPSWYRRRAEQKGTQK
jgi:excinuclease UvrABC nuclease subunit